MLYFNVLTIMIEFFAYYVYFAVEQDFSTFYQQLYKLALDLIPFWQNIFLVACGVCLFRLLAKKVEYWEFWG